MDEIDPALLSVVRGVLSKADIEINGTRPWDLKIVNPGIFVRVIRDGSLGFGEGYTEGWWECDDLRGFFHRLNRSKVYDLHPKNIQDVIKIVYGSLFSSERKTLPFRLKDLIKVLSIKFFNFQTKSLAIKNVEHYNLGDDLFVRVLGPYMQYSCGYWKDATTFEEAEEAKLRLLCEKLQLEPGMRVLDIGCGWGGLAKYMAKNYGVSVIGATVSSGQREHAEKLCAGLDVTILLKDYRDIEGQFDRIVSVEMFEHVGPKNHDTYFRVVDRCLIQDGLFVLQTTGSHEIIYKDEWIDKYFFPNINVPTLTQIASASEPYFVMEDMHNFGADYDKTLIAWRQRFRDAWPQISHKYGENFTRGFDLFLNCFNGASSSRRVQVWQFVFSRGREGGVCVPR